MIKSQNQHCNTLGRILSISSENTPWNAFTLPKEGAGMHRSNLRPDWDSSAGKICKNIYTTQRI